MNIEFEYLYRDAGNYKNWGGVVFSNPKLHDAESLRAFIRQAMSDTEYFDATAVRLPDLHFPEYVAELDLPLHEFFEVSVTDESPNDQYGRSIDELLHEIRSTGCQSLVKSESCS